MNETTNEKRTAGIRSKKVRIIKRVALILGLLAVVAVIFSSCGVQSIDAGKKPAEWKETTVNLTPEKNFLDHILSWVGTLLSWITAIMPANSYILALLLFAIIIELILLPFSIKQQKNSIKQAMLKPKEMAIRNRYKGRNDRVTQQKVSAEIQELYQKENFNMFSGCLPLLIQMPIILVLYYVVIDPIKYVIGMSGEFSNVVYAYMTSSVADGGLGLNIGATRGTIEMLSKMREIGVGQFEGIANFCKNGPEVLEQIKTVIDGAPNFNIGGVNLGYVPKLGFSLPEGDRWQYWLLLIPVLTFLAYFFSMKLNRKMTFQPTQNVDEQAAACSNNMMDITMPLMSVFISFSVPAAVGVYWIYKSIIGVGKQFVMNKAMPYPVFTEADYKAAEKEMYGKLPKKIQKSENAGKVRSLHHIDDDDYDEKGNYCPAPEEAAEEKDTVVNELPDTKMNEGATLKDETDRKVKPEKEKKNKKNKDGM